MAFPKAAICVLVFMVLGCATFMESRKMNRFDQAADAYGKAIRWSDFQAAQGFLKITSSEENLPDPDVLKQIRVVDYEVNQSHPSADKQTVQQVVTITYYRSNESLVKELTENELWQYDELSGKWLLNSGFPKFR